MRNCYPTAGVGGPLRARAPSGQDVFCDGVPSASVEGEDPEFAGKERIGRDTPEEGAKSVAMRPSKIYNSGTSRTSSTTTSCRTWACRPRRPSGCAGTIRRFDPPPKERQQREWRKEAKKLLATPKKRRRAVGVGPMLSNQGPSIEQMRQKNKRRIERMDEMRNGVKDSVKKMREMAEEGYEPRQIGMKLITLAQAE